MACHLPRQEHIPMKLYSKGTRFPFMEIILEMPCAKCQPFGTHLNESSDIVRTVKQCDATIFPDLVHVDDPF